MKLFPLAVMITFIFLASTAFATDGALQNFECTYGDVRITIPEEGTTANFSSEKTEGSLENLTLEASDDEIKIDYDKGGNKVKLSADSSNSGNSSMIIYKGKITVKLHSLSGLEVNFPSADNRDVRCILVPQVD